MSDPLSLWFYQIRNHVSTLSAVVTLLLTLFLAAAGPPETVKAQTPDQQPVIHQTTGGQTVIVSQQITLSGPDFATHGALTDLSASPAGLTLAAEQTEGVFLSEPLPSSLPFTSDISLSWQADIPQAAAIVVETRLSSDGLTWTEWQAVPADSYPIPDGQMSAGLLWVGQADTVLQLRVTLRGDAPERSPVIRQLSIYFNDTSQGPAPHAQAALDEEEALLPVQMCPPKPAVISREGWGSPGGADSPDWPPGYAPVSHIVLNHTASPNSASDWAGVVRSIWHFHAVVLGWGDIGYNYLIDPQGNIYEGRAGGDNVVGAFDGFNRGALGLGYIGCYGDCEKLGLTTVEPPSPMIEAGNRLIAWKLGQESLEPEGSGPYCEANLPTIIGRSAVTCRGMGAQAERLEDQLPAIREAAAGQLAACELPPVEAMAYGQVGLQGRTDPSAARISAGDYQLPVQADGMFQFPLTGLHYDLLLSAPGYLSAQASGELPAGQTELDLGYVMLPGGDVNGDAKIDILDLAYMGSHFGSSDPQGDINGDRTVDILDLTLAATNYGRQGPLIIGLEARVRQVIEQAGITPLDPGPAPAAAKVALGQALYFDKELSGNRDVACSTCHLPSQHTGDGLPVSIGVGGAGLGPARQLGAGHKFIPRNAPEIFNRGAPLWESMFWDGRITGHPGSGFVTPAGAALPAGLDNILAAQAMFPVTSRDEMRGQPGDSDIFGQPNELALLDDDDFAGMWSALIARLLKIDAYASLFQAAYPDVSPEQLGFEHAANAIAAFEIEAFTFTNSPWDRFVAGDETALSDAAQQGALLFYGKAQCGQCHSGNLFTDQAHHNLGMPQVGDGKGAEAPLDFGRGRETGSPADRYAFRTPPLRNVTLTGPWSHAGAYTSFEAVVRHHLDPTQALLNYNVTQLRADLQPTFQDDPAFLDEVLSTLDPLVAAPTELTDAEFDQLLAFLQALTDPAALDLSHTAPDQVPSGLPVDP